MLAFRIFYMQMIEFEKPRKRRFWHIAIFLLLFIAILASSRFLAGLKEDAIKVSTALHNPPQISIATFLDREDHTFDRVTYGRIYDNLRLHDVDPAFIHDLIAVEDEKFYEHSGVNWLSILGASVRLAYFRSHALLRGMYAVVPRKKIRGGSTITQQLIKNVLGTPPRTVYHKLREIYLAIYLENHLQRSWFHDAKDSKRKTKNLILSHYLNRFYSAEGIYGFRNGAYIFLGSRDVSRLDPEQRIIMLSLINAPGIINGKSEASRHAMFRRIRQRLRATGRRDKISEKNDGENIEKNVEENKRSRIRRGWQNRRLYLRRKLIGPQTGIARSYMSLFADGKMQGSHLIHTYRDTKIDAKMSLLFRSEMRRLNHSIGKDCAVAGAFILLRLKDGAVLSTGNDPCASFDQTTGARRPIYSTFKPFLYAVAMDRLDYNPATVIIDRHFEVRDRIGRKYAPANHYHMYRGPMSLKSALKRSANTVSLQLLDRMSPYTVTGIISSIFKLHAREKLRKRFHNDYALALGSVELSPAHLAAGYLSLLGGGTKKYPKWERLSKTDTRRPGPERVINRTVAYQIREMLTGTMRSGGTARREVGNQSRLILKELGGKSGSGPSDSWFAGFSEDLLLVVWIGFRNNKKPEGSRPIYAVPIWKKMFVETMQRYPPAQLRYPPELTRAYYCSGRKLQILKNCSLLESALFAPGQKPKSGHSG